MQTASWRRLSFRRAGVAMPDALWGVAEIVFEYQPGIERRWFHDAHGQAAKDVDGIYGEELTLNQAGAPTDITNLDDSSGHMRDNNGVMHYVRTLDNHNRVVTLQRIGLLGTAITDNYGYFETRTVFDVMGRSMERGNYDASGNPLNNNDGIALVRTTYTLYPDSTQTINSFFDASGLAAAEKSTGAHIIQRTTDERGLLLDECYFDITGAPTVTTDDTVHERRYTYDDRGNQLTEEFFDSDGKPCNQKGSEFAKVAYKYDDKNRVIETSYFGDDGTPQILLNLGAAVVRQEYDEQGNIARLQFFDGRGHPSPHVTYGVPAIRIKVDGDTTIVTLHNGDDRPIKNPVNGYYAFSYKTATDKPLSLTNTYYDRHGREMSILRVRIINPHLHADQADPVDAVERLSRRGRRGHRFAPRLLDGVAQVLPHQAPPRLCPLTDGTLPRLVRRVRDPRGHASFFHDGLLGVDRLRERADGPRLPHRRDDLRLLLSLPALSHDRDDAGPEHRPGRYSPPRARFLRPDQPQAGMG